MTKFSKHSKMNCLIVAVQYYAWIHLKAGDERFPMSPGSTQSDKYSAYGKRLNFDKIQSQIMLFDNIRGTKIRFPDNVI